MAVAVDLFARLPSEMHEHIVAFMDAPVLMLLSSTNHKMQEAFAVYANLLFVPMGRIVQTSMIMNGVPRRELPVNKRSLTWIQGQILKQWWQLTAAEMEQLCAHATAEGFLCNKGRGTSYPANKAYEFVTTGLWNISATLAELRLAGRQRNYMKKHKPRTGFSDSGLARTAGPDWAKLLGLAPSDNTDIPCWLRMWRA